jgi:hypothetical protein
MNRIVLVIARSASRDEAIQSAHPRLDCFASLAMTTLENPATTRWRQ